MKEKTKLKIIQKIAQNLSLQDKFTQTQRVAVWAFYLLQLGIFQICLLISIAQPQLHINEKLAEYPSIQLALFFIRLVVAGIYLVTRSSYVVPLIKLLQITNVYLLRTEFCAIPLILQGLAEAYLTIRKQKRNTNFDSRLQSKYFGTKVFSIYILLFATFLTPNSEISKNPSAVFFTAIIYYVAACLDNIYSYRTKEILRNIALCPILMAIYFMCVPLVPAVNTFGLAAHSLVSLAILFVIVVYAIISEYTFQHDILYKKILNLESRDKLLYIWSLIYFCQSPTQNELICFLKTHQSKCFNSLCPLNFNTSSGRQANNFSLELIQNSIKIYLKKALERFASESDEIRRLFIYYRKEDDPKIVHLLREDDVYEKIEEFRISKNLERYNDPSLQYEQMKEIQQQTLTKVKLFLNHYDYFLSYINKESIKMQTSQEIIKELLKLKNYFLSFKPNSAQEIEEQKQMENAQGKKKSRKNSRGYEKLDTETIPVKKMTLKTIILVNFMRKVYFSLPSLEKEQFSTKKLTYISEDFEQSPIMIISAQAYNLGKIINWNSMAQKILLYSTKQLRSKFINDLLPKVMHKIHEKIFMKAALSIELGEVRKQLSAFVFCITKASYVEVFDIKIQGANSISGNKWVVEMKHHFESQAIVICDQYKSVIGVNRNAINFGISLNATGETMNDDLFNRLMQKKKDKVTIGIDIEPIGGVKMEMQTQWELVCDTPTVEDMPKFHIFMVEHSHQIEKMTLSRFTRRAQTNPNPDFTTTPEPTNGFQFNFDPYLLKYTNDPIPEHYESDLQMVWQQNQSMDDNDPNEFNYKEGSQRKIINYGDNIHQMIYFDSKLQFKQNYEQVTEFQTHPNYLQNGKMSSSKNVIRLNINKDNFVENVSKIKEKMPSYVYKLIILFSTIFLILLVCLTLRFILFNSLYSLSKQRQLLGQQMINRKNLLDNIGSLAVYYDKLATYPTIWERFLTNEWTFEQLFVQIEYTNGKINKLNNDIGLLVNRNYQVSNKTRTLASYFESLSIEASTQSTGQLNLTQFISEIVDDIESMENMIQNDVNEHYQKEKNALKRNIFIIDLCQLVAVVISAVIMHFIIKKSYKERVLLFKSLSVIEQEEIYRIQKNLNDHREQIKNNQLDVVQEDDYSEPLDSQNIPHTKKMLNSYFKSKMTIFYVFIFIVLTVSACLFIISSESYNKVGKIQLVTPFINIVGQQRNSMAKMYLNLIADTKNSTWITSTIMKNIRMFQVNKKGVIDSLIVKQFSDDYLSFYNEIWFNPCDVLGVSTQCSELFSGILSDNLDYNYVYILTEVEKIVDYRVQAVTPPLSMDPQFVKDVKSQIQISFKKINFLLFDFMIRLQETFTAKTTEEIQFLFKSISSDNLIQFLIEIGASILVMVLLSYLVYSVKDLPNETLEMVTTVIPYSILMRNQYFVDWYKNKFKNVY